MNDFELEKHYKPENFMTEEELSMSDCDMQEKIDDYNSEIDEAILEAMKRKK